MTASGAAVNLCAYVLQTSLFLAVGLLLPVLFRMGDPRVRYRYWATLLAVSLLLPLLILPAGRPAQGGAGATAYMAGAMTMTVQPGTRPFSPWPWVLGLLATVAAVRLLWIVVGLIKLERTRRGSPVVHPLPSVFLSSAEQLGIGAEFRVSGEVRSPLTFGWRRPVVLLPSAFESLDSEAQRCITLHELLHVKRGDWPVILAEEILRSLLWFHPAVWLVLDRIALCREQVVDREVVRLTHERTAYMNTLAAMARLRQNAAAVAFLPFFHRSHLLQRLALLTKEVSMSKLRLGLTIAGSVAVLLFAGVVATRAFPLMGTTGDQPATQKGSSPTSQLKPPLGVQPEGGVYPMGSVPPPKLLKQVAPDYPPEAKEKGISGRVAVQIVINERGEATAPKVMKSDNEIFNAAATAAVSQWRFEPPMLDGHPVKVYWMISINFTAEK